ncbi:MAG: hypothetical protein QG646_1277 [Euryarchaeota archaeon]|nr:hypothetical protein [Euryarchaeota archaeon]
MEKEQIEKDTYYRAKKFLLRNAWTQGVKDSCSFKDNKRGTPILSVSAENVPLEGRRAIILILKMEYGCVSADIRENSGALGEDAFRISGKEDIDRAIAHKPSLPILSIKLSLLSHTKQFASNIY